MNFLHLDFRRHHNAAYSGKNQSSAEFCCILWITCCTFICMYGPQPLLTSIAETFAVSKQSAGLVMTLNIAPLALAPILYGFILSRFTTFQLLSGALPLVAAILLIPAFTDSFNIFLSARALHGMLTPAVMLSLMTHIVVNANPAQVQRQMALYAAFTMIGSFSGRLMAGAVGTIFNWRASFILFSGLMISSLIALLFLNRHTISSYTVFSLRSIWQTLSQRGFFAIMMIAPLTIFAHASILNFLPFYMKHLHPEITDFGISSMYLLAFSCSSLGFLSKRVIAFFGNEMKGMRAGLIVFLCVLPALFLKSIPAICITMFGTSIGFTLVYTTMPGIVNRISCSGTGITNGIYLSVYYCCSAIGTWAPLYLYGHYGLNPYLLTLSAAICTALTITCLNTKREIKKI
ncbi:MAG: MFS transporter [Desulfovibrionaceae bacterium]|nr:MFS transporter [Desulfovibrionaceae bacterium]